MMVMTGNREKKTTYFALFLHWANIEQEREMKKIITVNAGPEMGWNKESLIMEASKGAESAGAAVERFDLFRLEKYTGCISCFRCKTEEFKGHCVCRDGLTPVLDAIQEADGMIIGYPSYYSDMTSSARALYERLIFPYLTDNYKIACRKEPPIPVLVIINCKVPDAGFLKILRSYQRFLSSTVGPAQFFISGNTLESGDYSRSGSDEQEEHHQTICPKEYKKVFQLGVNLAS